MVISRQDCRNLTREISQKFISSFSTFTATFTLRIYNTCRPTHTSTLTHLLVTVTKSATTDHYPQPSFMTSTVTVNALHVEKLLADLRDVPVNTGSDSCLAPIYSYLMAISPNTSDGVLHWFCARADQITIDAATFLIRLYAYNSPLVDNWKKRLEFCLGGCCDCIRGLEEVKVSSRDT